MAGKSSALVEIDLSNMVWYVDGDASTNGNGTGQSPMNSLVDLQGLGGIDAEGDIIYVSGSLNIPFGENVELESNQHLIGAGVELSVNGQLLSDATTSAVINSTVFVTGRSKVMGLTFTRGGVSSVDNLQSLEVDRTRFQGPQTDGIRITALNADFSLTVTNSEFVDLHLYGIRTANVGTVDATIVDNYFSGLDRGFFRNSQRGFTDVRDNHFERIGEFGIRLGTDTVSIEDTAISVTGNEFVDAKVAVSIHGSNTSEYIPVEIVGNTIVSSTVQEASAIYLSGHFSFHTDALSANQIGSSYRVGLETNHARFDDLELGDYHAGTGLHLGGTGNVRIASIIGRAHEGGFRFNNDASGGLFVTIDEFRVFQQGRLVGSTHLLESVNTNLTIGSGSIIADELLILQTNGTLNATFDSLVQVDSELPEKFQSRFLDISNAEQFIVNGRVFSQNQMRLGSGNYEFNDTVRIDQSNLQFRNTGIHIQGKTAPTVDFHDTVFVSDAGIAGIRIDNGNTTFNGAVIVWRQSQDDGIDTSNAILTGGSETNRRVAIVFAGGLSVFTTGNALVGTNTELSIVGNGNRIVTSGGSFFDMTELVVGQEGINLSQVIHNRQSAYTTNLIHTGESQQGVFRIGTLSTSSTSLPVRSSAGLADWRLPIEIDYMNAHRTCANFENVQATILDGRFLQSSLKLIDSNLDVTLREFSIGNRHENVLQLDRTTGRFSITGDGSESQGGNGSGGTVYNIHTSSTSYTNALWFRDAENVSLNNMRIIRARYNAIKAENVRNFSFNNSKLYDSYFPIWAVDLTGSVAFENSSIIKSQWAMRISNSKPLDSLRIVGTSFVDTEVQVYFSGAAAAATIARNTFSNTVPAFSQLEIKVAPNSTAAFSVFDNTFRNFQHAASINVEGHLEMDFARNTFHGKSDGTSLYAINVNVKHSGAIEGQIVGHRGSKKILRSRGINVAFDGYTNSNLTKRSELTISNNEVVSLPDATGISVAVDNRAYTNVVARVSYNTIVGPPITPFTGISIIVGLQNESANNRLTAAINNNVILSSAETGTVGFFVNQNGEDQLNLVAPILNPLVGSTLIDSDGGLLLSKDRNGNKNAVTDLVFDVLVDGEITIV